MPTKDPGLSKVGGHSGPLSGECVFLPSLMEPAWLMVWEDTLLQHDSGGSWMWLIRDGYHCTSIIVAQTTTGYLGVLKS